MNAKWVLLGLEIAIAYRVGFTYQSGNVLVPNVYFWNPKREADLVLWRSGTGYCDEYELKTSLADLRNEKNKEHNHENKYIRRLYFVIPDYVNSELALSHIPARAGLITVRVENHRHPSHWKSVQKRAAKINRKALKPDTHLVMEFMRRGCQRLWKTKCDRAANKFLDLNEGINGIPVAGGVNHCRWNWQGLCLEPEISNGTEEQKRMKRANYDSKRNCSLTILGCNKCSGFKEQSK